MGLLDWGQIKRIPEPLVMRFAEMVEALNGHNQSHVAHCFGQLGVSVEKPQDLVTTVAVARTMLDTKVVPGFDMNPFSSDNAIKSNAVTNMPTDLYFLVRTVQLMRGIAYAFELDYSLAQAWAPFARRTIKELTTVKVA